VGAAAPAVVGAVLDPEARARAVPEETVAAQLRKVIQAGRIQIPGSRVIGTIPSGRGRLVQILAEPIRTRTGGLTRMIPMRKIRRIKIVRVRSTGTRNQRTRGTPWGLSWTLAPLRRGFSLNTETVWAYSFSSCDLSVRSPDWQQPSDGARRTTVAVDAI
jgi:hypothetical protein